MDIRTQPLHHADLRQPLDEGAVLRFDGVTVTFDDIRALDAVTFSVPKGHTRILFGAAGSGKSVLLKTSIGLVRPDSGSVYLFGEDISRADEEDLFVRRGRVGMLFQESGLFDSLTVEENVAYPILNQQTGRKKRARPDPEAVNQRVRETLSFVELEHTLSKYPSELSGGMRRRVGIARAAVTEPPLMLYDSPTAGLDPITANTIMALIVKARDVRHTTSVIVTHRQQDGHIMANFRYNPENAKLEQTPAGSGIHETTMFMVFREGRLVFEGTQEELDAATDSYVARFRTARPS